MIELDDMRETKRNVFSKKDFFAPKPKNILGEPLLGTPSGGGDPLSPVSKSINP
jgi:hypothetical protein